MSTETFQNSFKMAYKLSEAEKEIVSPIVKDFWSKKLKTEITPIVEKKILTHIKRGHSLSRIKTMLEVEKSLAEF